MANQYLSEKIIPAVMPQGFDHLREEMKRFVSLVPTVQIDVMDGILTESKSWPYKNGTDSDFLKIVNQEEGFPFWEDLNIEADLMVSDPAKTADQWIAAGATRIIVHFESAASDIIAAVLKSIKEKGIEAGLAVGLQTAPEALTVFYDTNKDFIDVIQFMGIEKIGFQGEPFDDRVIESILEFKKSFPEAKISVDGGVHRDSALRLAEAGADVLVVGSDLKEESVAEAISDFDAMLASKEAE